MKELEKYFLLDEFEDGWGMDDEFICEEQLFDYCVEVLFIPDEKIDELNMRNDELEIVKKNNNPKGHLNKNNQNKNTFKK